MIPINSIYFGVCENTKDPSENGNIQVRVEGIHNPDKNALPTSMLPWCKMMMPITSASFSGVGSSPTGIVEGSRVILLSIDELMQEWLCLGSWHGYDIPFVNSSNGFNGTSKWPTSEYLNQNDVNLLARGKSSTALDNINTNQSDTVVTDKWTNQQPVTPITSDQIKNAPWYTIAQSLIGINQTDNADKVKQFLHYGGLDNASASTPWCASFVGYCLENGTPSIKGTRAGNARSYANYGKAVDYSNWDKVPVGAIVVFVRPPSPYSGHVAFYTGKHSGQYITVLGGNQGSSAGDGLGGRVKESNFPVSQVIAVRWPNTSN